MVMGNRTISEVAASTGFTASALRFYEGAGLLSPQRTTAGYRVYNDRDVERLRFIARAKQLGLRLDEITELMSLWDGDRCAPVAGRLRELVHEKLHATERSAAELVAFARDLQRFDAKLSPELATGSCGDGCVCVSSEPTPAIACTLERAQMSGRIADWRRVIARATVGPGRVEGGLAMHFPADAELAAELAALAAAEQSCCNFLLFTVRIDQAGIHVTVTAPSEAVAFIEELFGVPA